MFFIDFLLIFIAYTHIFMLTRTYSLLTRTYSSLTRTVRPENIPKIIDEIMQSPERQDRIEGLGVYLSLSHILHTHIYVIYIYARLDFRMPIAPAMPDTQLWAGQPAPNTSAEAQPPYVHPRSWVNRRGQYLVQMF